MIPSNTVILPVGIEKDGKIYRKVTVSEMNGFDEENMSTPAVRKNGAKAQSILLRRCIQEIEGLVPLKTRPNLLIDESIVRSMCSYDRDFLFFNIRMIGGVEDVEFIAECPSCSAQSKYSKNISDLAVYEWDDSEPRSISIDLSKGIFVEGKEYTEFEWKFLNGEQQERIARLDQNKVISASLFMGCQGFRGLDDHVVTENDFRMLPSQARIDAMTQIAEEAPGLQTAIEIECPHCSYEFEHMLDVSLFFEPKAKPKKKDPKRTKKRRLRR